jgi:hypothetical protein
MRDDVNRVDNRKQDLNPTNPEISVRWWNSYKQYLTILNTHNDPAVRREISTFAKLPSDIVNKDLGWLSDDLYSGG